MARDRSVKLIHWEKLYYSLKIRNSEAYPWKYAFMKMCHLMRTFRIGFRDRTLFMSLIIYQEFPYRVYYHNRDPPFVLLAQMLMLWNVLTTCSFIKSLRVHLSSITSWVKANHACLIFNFSVESLLLFSIMLSFLLIE